MITVLLVWVVLGTLADGEGCDGPFEEVGGEGAEAETVYDVDQEVSALTTAPALAMASAPATAEATPLV